MPAAGKGGANQMPSPLSAAEVKEWLMAIEKQLDEQTQRRMLGLSTTLATKLRDGEPIEQRDLDALARRLRGK
jgi:hypothetical protein